MPLDELLAGVIRKNDDKRYALVYIDPFTFWCNRHAFSQGLQILFPN